MASDENRTVTEITSTHTYVATSLTRFTPISTTTVSATVTVGGNMKRDARIKDAQVTERAVIDEAAAFMGHFRHMRRQANSTAAPDTSVASALSSVCSCLEIAPGSTTATYTDQAAVRHTEPVSRFYTNIIADYYGICEEGRPHCSRYH